MSKAVLPQPFLEREDITAALFNQLASHKTHY